MNQETLAIYAQDLSPYELDHIAAVLEAIGKEAPQDYKQLWPAIGIILDAVRGRIRASRPSAEQLAKDAWDAHVAKCRAEGLDAPDPELQALIDKLNLRISL